jgi:hypothetical protein
MYAFGNSARRKHFIGGDSDLDHGFIRQDVGILALRERRVCILTLYARGDLPPMNSPEGTNGSGQYFRNDDWGSHNRYLWRLERGWFDACSGPRQE